jgi:hypothetical protein
MVMRAEGDEKALADKFRQGTEAIQSESTSWLNQALLARKRQWK